jgi:hypothetical protein
MTQTQDQISIRPLKPFGRRVDIYTDYADLTLKIDVEDGHAGGGWIVDEKTVQPCGTWTLASKKPPSPPPQAKRPPSSKPERRLLPPGSWLSMAIMVGTGGLLRPCAKCKSRASLLDRAGWLGVPRLLISRRFWKPIPGGCRGDS